MKWNVYTGSLYTYHMYEMSISIEITPLNFKILHNLTSPLFIHLSCSITSTCIASGCLKQ